MFVEHSIYANSQELFLRVWLPQNKQHQLYHSVNNKLKLKILASSVALASPLLSQDNAAIVQDVDPLTVTASPFDRPANELSLPWSVLEGNQLNKARGVTIGETLDWQPGISQSLFSAGASRPVIRGMEGKRVRILSNGLGTQDMSSTSADHPITIDPLLVDQIEILRGPANLLYGGNAIGGAVNLVDSRIARQSVDEISGAFATEYSSVDEGKYAGLKVDIPFNQLVLHVDGIFRETEDYETPTFAPHADEPDETATSVQNSFTDTDDIAVGLSYISENGHIGFVFNQIESQIGLLTEHEDDGMGGEEVHSPFLDMEQTRFIVDGEWAINSDLIESISAAYVYSDYDHGEYEEPGQLGTAYELESHETRWELDHAAIAGFEGIFGIQLNLDEMHTPSAHSIFGEDRINNIESSKFALFIAEEKALSEKLRWEVGSRLETTDYEISGLDTSAGDRDFTSFSIATAVVYDLNDNYAVSGNLAYSERAPSIEELYSRGAHHGTESFDIGNSDLGEEESLGINIAVRKKAGAVTGEFAFFANQFDNFIYSRATGNEVDEEGDPFVGAGHGFDEREYVGVEAEFYGFELSGETEVYNADGKSIMFRAMVDYTRATNETDGGNLPRIPPFRIGGELEYTQGSFIGSVQVRHAFEQDNFSPEETATPDFTLLNLRGSYAIPQGDNQVEIFIEGNNLTDELAYISTSFRKDASPMPGRSINVGLNYSF